MVDCVTAAWEAWSKCTTPCGTGSHSRERAQSPARHGGKACPHSAETQQCNTRPCPQVCSSTKCTAAIVAGEWRTTVQYASFCAEKHGADFHCQHHKGTVSHKVLGGGVQTHTNECVCYCDNESAGSHITHHHGDNGGATTTRNVGSKLHTKSVCHK